MSERSGGLAYSSVLARACLTAQYQLVALATYLADSVSVDRYSDLSRRLGCAYLASRT